MANTDAVWWESDEQIKPFRIVSRFNVTLWGETHNLGFSPNVANPDEILQRIYDQINEFVNHEKHGRFYIDEAIHVLRQIFYTDHPDRLRWVAKFEAICRSSVSTDFLETISCTSALDATYFHVMRTYLQEKDIDVSIALWEQINKNLIPDIPPVSRIPILLQYFIAQTFSNKWIDSVYTLNSMWATLFLSTTETSRFSLGLWDEWAVLLILIWFMCKYVPEYIKFYAEKIQMSINDPFGFQRKSMIMNIVSVDKFISQLICSSLLKKEHYLYCKSIYPSLPDVEL